VEHTPEVLLAVTPVLVGLAHVSVPDSINQMAGRAELFGHSRCLVVSEKLPVFRDTTLDLLRSKRTAFEDAVTNPQGFLDLMQIKGRKVGLLDQGGIIHPNLIDLHNSIVRRHVLYPFSKGTSCIKNLVRVYLRKNVSAF